MLYRTLYEQSMFLCKHLLIEKFDLHRIGPEVHRVKIKVQNMSSTREETRFLFLGARKIM